MFTSPSLATEKTETLAYWKFWLLFLSYVQNIPRKALDLEKNTFLSCLNQITYQFIYYSDLSYLTFECQYIVMERQRAN